MFKHLLKGGGGNLRPEDIGFDISNPEQAREWERLQSAAEDRRKLMSPPRSLGLSELLDQRRLDFGIPDDAFEVQPIFDACCVWQVPAQGRKVGSIHLPQQVADAERESASIGILCGAGPLALDHFACNGVEVGHFVRFVKLAPYRSLIGYVGMKAEWLLEIRAAHVRGSLDLRQALLDRRVAMVTTKNSAGFPVHHFKDHEGNIWKPTMPWADKSE